MEKQVFNPGDKVKCIDDGASFNRLGEGNIYTVDHCDENAVYLIGVRSSHSSERFELVGKN